jgi:hypothetical protein
LESIKDRVDRHAERLDFSAIDIQVDLRHLRAECGEWGRDPRLRRRCGNQRIRSRLQGGQAGAAPILYLKFEAASVADA